MREAPHISDIRFAPARPELRSTGLLGWVCCALNGELQIDGIALRKGRDGRHLLSFPRRVDSSGVEHDYIKPLSNGVRDAIEGQVIDELRRRGYVT
jgi:hypothetical protein